MREVALKHHLQRYVSPYLLQVATDYGEEEPGQLALLFCDLSWAEESATAPVDVVLHREGRLTRAVSVMLEHGAVVDLPQGDMILAAIHDTTPGQAAQRAVSAAFELVAALARLSHTTGQPDTAGIGVTSIDLGTADKGLVAEALNATALLQAASGGRVLVDYAVAEALGQQHHPTEVSGVELPGTRNHVYEVRP